VRLAGDFGSHVKLDKLAKQLRRDLTASPKKAAALGLMLLVAAYFWLPMIWGWLGPKQTKQPVAAGSVILEDEQPTNNSLKSKAGRTFRWEQVRHRMLADPLMASAEYDVAWPDPFRSDSVAAAAQAASAAPAGETLAGVVDPAGLGLVLTSAVVGPKRRTAIISGRTYCEGETVKPAVSASESAGASVAPLEFRLEKIGPWEVELTALGQRYTLQLARAQLTGGDELIHHDND
jgi:hypothetical protein